MPEGPSIIILREQAAGFAGKVIRRAEGNAKVDMPRLQGRRVEALRSFGKQFLIDLGSFSARIHLLMFGSYRIDERKDSAPRLSLGFDHGELNFYSCSVRLIERQLADIYDWRADVMSDEWDPALARKKLRTKPDTLVCDALLDQEVFAGVGNIIKNEVLYRVRVHPLSTVGALPPRKLRQLVEQARVYAFEFLAWKKALELRKQWLVHNRTLCPRHDIPPERAHLGKTHRRSFYCELCQKRYGSA
ncbi:MAG: DNA-formamidopyrimidine glycosylase family protein [Rhodanobacter sp.]